MATKSKEAAKKARETVINPPFKVAGIGADLDDIVLNSKRFRAQVDLGIQRADLTRTMEGASTVELDIHDPEKRLLNHAMFRQRVGMELDGLHFTFVQMGKSGKTITPVFEEREVNWLRQYKGPRKALRGRVTRAEFVLSLIRSVREADIPVYIPELHKRQPIRSIRDHQREEDDQESRSGGPGLGKADLGTVTVKGVDADLTRLHYIDVVLDTGMSMGANFKVLVSAIACITQESNVTIMNESGGIGLFSQLDNGYWPASGDPATDARAYFRDAIESDRSNPRQSIAALVQSVQHAGIPAYQQWADEATQTVRTYLGGAEAGDSVSQTILKPYAFEVKKTETYWAAIQRLAKEVNWRAFFVNGRFFFISEEDLFRGQVRLQFNEDSRGIDTIDFDVDSGKRTHEATVIAHARRWGVPPGMVVRMGDVGPANGRWLVSKIEGSLLPGEARLVTITLKKPSRELPEPAPETRSGSLSIPGTGSEALDAMIEEADRIDSKKYDYLWGGGHSNPPPANGPYDCSGAVCRVLYVGGLIDRAVVSGELAGMYQAGKGKSVTIYANAEHVFMELDGRFFGTSKENPGGGAGWHSSRSAAGFSLRHPRGM